MDIASADQIEAAGQIRNLLSIYDTNYDLISIGAYKSGSNKALDHALARIEGIHGFLQQGVSEKLAFTDSVELMRRAVS